MIIVGLEAANSYVKVKTPLTTDCYMNTLREIKTFESDFLNDSQQIIKIKDKKYVVGEPNGSSSSGRDVGKYRSEKYLHENLCALARNVQDDQDITLVTALPCEDYKRKGLINDVKNNLLGTYTVTIENETKRINVKNVQVIIQPLGSLIHRIYDSQGYLRKGREKERYEKILIIDVGYGTTDIVHVENMKPIDYKGANVGMIDAMNDLYDFIVSNNNDINGLPMGLELDNLARGNNSLSVGGKSYNIVEEKEKAFSYTAEKVIEAVKKQGFDIRGYDRVLFTGGSIEPLSPYLKTYLEGINAVRMSAEESQLANAIGYYTYGVVQYAN